MNSRFYYIMQIRGYPDKLKEFGKIIAVCDVFDALTTKRSYKDAISTFETLIIMKKEMAYHLDGILVDFFIKMFKEKRVI
ncbi:MAG: hypothetical protein C0625_14455 [Arcobacter sp.]|nr:MAG: hypothetical protein C0625_14455 [Arcobacter sp.]